MFSSRSFVMTCLRMCLVWYVLLARASATDNDDDEDYELDRCTRWHHASMLRGDQIFVDGGVQLNRDNDTTWLGFSKYIFQIDMSVPWNASTNFTEKRIARFGSTATGSNPPNMVRGALYRGPGNDSRVFTFGGSTFIANTSDPDWQPPSSNEYSLWTFDTSLQTWNQYDVSSAVPQRPNRGSIGEVIGGGIGFYLNGQVDKGSSNVLYSTAEYVGGELSNATNDQISYLDGMIIIDMPTQEARNVSTETLGAPRVSGGLVHSYGFGKTTNGTLVAFGGMRSGDPDNNTFTNGVLIDFDTVSLCDSFGEENVTWVNQTTTGDIPPPRVDFCTLPMPKYAKDNSSFTFHIYGGYDPLNSTMFDDVYALSIPSFTWTKLYSGSNPRFGHTCNSAGNRQMVVIGGSLNASMFAVETTGQIPDLTTLTCDTDEGMRLFDLTDLTWGPYFDYYAAAYQVPDVIVDVIGGTPDGGATMRQPAGGFDNAAITTMFNPPAATSTSTSKKSNAGAIAGGVVGAVVGIGIITGLIVYMLRKRKAKTAPQTPDPQPEATELGGETAYHMLHANKPPAEMFAEDGAKELESGFAPAPSPKPKFYEMPADVPSEHR